MTNSYRLSIRALRFLFFCLLICACIYQIHLTFIELPVFTYSNGFASMESFGLLFYIIFLLLLVFHVFTRLRFRLDFVVYLFFVVSMYLRHPIIDWGDWILVFNLIILAGMNIKEDSFYLRKVGATILRVHVVFILALNGLRKLFHMEWLEGSAMQFFAAGVYGHAQNPVVELLKADPTFSLFAGYVVICLQLLSPILLLVKTRTLICFFIAIYVLLHLVIGLVLGHWFFQFVMIFSLLIFISDPNWSWLNRKTLNLQTNSTTYE